MDRQLPTVSVVIPVFNGEKYIKEAVDSVLDQEYPHVELIVLDDGSTDGTSKILNQYQEKFYWEKHENMGQAATLNKGWKMAKGSILSYLSADDLLMPHAVSKSVNYLEKHPEKIMTYCDFNLIDPQSHIIRRVRAADFNYYDMVVNFVCHPGPGVFFRQTAYQKAGGWNGKYRQMPDYEYWLRLGLTGDFYHIPEILASFRVHNESQTFAKGDPAKSDEPIHIISEYFKRNDIPCYIRNFGNKVQSNAYLTSAQLHWRADRFKTAINYFYLSFILYPMNIVSYRSLRLLLNVLLNRVFHKILWNIKRLKFKGRPPKKEA